MILDQLVSITDIRKNASKYLNQSDETFFVIVNNKPKKVIQPLWLSQSPHQPFALFPVYS